MMFILCPLLPQISEILMWLQSGTTEKHLLYRWDIDSLDPFSIILCVAVILESKIIHTV